MILSVHTVNIPPPSWEGPAISLSLMWVQGIGVLAMAMHMPPVLTHIVVILLSLASHSKTLDAKTPRGCQHESLRIASPDLMLPTEDLLLRLCNLPLSIILCFFLSPGT